MGKYNSKKRHSIDIIFVMILFAIFSLLSVLLIMIGSNVYNEISNNDSNNSDVRTSLSYVANKVRSYDNKNAVYVDEINGIEALVMEQDTEGKTIQTLLFYKDGYLKETTIIKGDEFTNDFGDKIMKLNSFDIVKDEAKKLFTFTITDSNNREQSISVALRSDN